ncbi:MAG: cytochrome c oxidase subunit II [Lysobacter spongiicola]|nr:cytochrome c oxidase subunit II [Lysobacter spongiicola]
MPVHVDGNKLDRVPPPLRVLNRILVHGAAPLLLALAAGGCDGPASTLAPAARGASDIAHLFLVMAVGATVVWAAVVGIALYAAFLRPRPHGRRTARWLVLGGGVLVPTLTLGALLLYGLVLMPQLREPAPHDGLRIAVSGEQWWWRVDYHLPAQDAPVTLANEIRLPVGERIEFQLRSPDVIHSFWIPPLGGKLDMIPGRTTTLILEPTRTGTFRGICAEYCGASHARMQFVAQVMEREAFNRWLDAQAAPAKPATGTLARRGEQAFLAHGCGACHTVRGTPAAGRVGPDLTHVGSRLSLAAGVLPNDTKAFRDWVAHPEAAKPGVLMPAFGMLPEEDLDAIAAYLEGLQ